MVLLKKEKEQQLRELTMVVTGIRLFNKVSKGGAEETDLDEPSTVHHTADMKSNIMAMIIF